MLHVRCPVSGTAAASPTQTAALPLQRAGFLSRCRNTIRLQSCIHRDNVNDVHSVDAVKDGWRGEAGPSVVEGISLLVWVQCGSSSAPDRGDQHVPTTSYFWWRVLARHFSLCCVFLSFIICNISIDLLLMNQYILSPLNIWMMFFLPPQ